MGMLLPVIHPLIFLGGRGKALLSRPPFLWEEVSKAALNEGDIMRVEVKSPLMNIGRYTQQCTFS